MLKIGDRVKLSTAFCRRIQADYEVASLRGEIINIISKMRSLPVAKVRWADGKETGCLISNLTKEKHDDYIR